MRHRIATYLGRFGPTSRLASTVSARAFRSVSAHPGRTACVLLAAFVVMAGLSIREKSPVFDEIAHLTAGYSYWMTGDYRKRLRRHMVWDYSPGNIQALHEMGISDVTLCPIGYASNLSRITPAQQQDIDVLFIGSINQRRRQILNNLQAAGIDVRWGFDIYGRDRDNYFARAKLVLNMHMYDAKVFEIVRVSYLLANRVCVVSETGADPELESKFTDGVAFADVDELAETCQRLLGDPVARRILQDEGFATISSLPQRDFLRAALEESGSQG